MEHAPDKKRDLGPWEGVTKVYAAAFIYEKQTIKYSIVI